MVEPEVKSVERKIGINQEFFSLEEVMQVEGQEVLVKDIYRKIKFE